MRHGNDNRGTPAFHPIHEIFTSDLKWTVFTLYKGVDIWGGGGGGGGGGGKTPPAYVRGGGGLTEGKDPV